MSSNPSTSQLFARGQGQPIQTGPFLGGYLLPITAVTAGTALTFTNRLRVVVRHVEVWHVGVLGEYPSRVSLTVNNANSFTVVFESAQSAGAFLFIC